MKRKSILILSALLIGLTGYTQKKELRDAAKLIKQGSFTQAKATLASIEALMGSADADTQAEYYLYLSQAYSGPATLTSEDISKSAEAINKLRSFSNSKFTKEIDSELYNLRVKIVNSAVADQNSGNHQSAADKLYASYMISPKDTSDLYYAAINSVSAKNYDQAVSYFEKLHELGFVGNTVTYTAVDKSTGEEEKFSSKEDRDLLLKTGQYTKPAQITSSKRGDVISSLGILYIEQKKLDKAKALIEEARRIAPNDISLIQADAEITYKLGDMERYDELMQEVVAADPNNPVLYYNLGVSAANIKSFDKAEEYYKMALSLDPDYYDANINLAVLISDKAESIIDEMNSLGMSAADNKKYEALQVKLHGVYEQAIPYLEKAVELRPNNVDVLRSLMNIHSVLGNDEKAKMIKAKIESGQ